MDLIPISEAADSGDLDAGSFEGWRADFQHGRTGTGVDVPCGDCNACCRAGMFIHVEPDELAALAKIPAAVLFPAPNLPAGHRVMATRADGSCPMLGESGCTIYADRPRTCRRFDCRAFAATGFAPGDSASTAMAGQSRRWRFETGPALERIRAIARWLTGQPKVPRNAIAIADLSLRLDDGSEPSFDALAERLERLRRLGHESGS